MAGARRSDAAGHPGTTAAGLAAGLTINDEITACRAPALRPACHAVKQS
jgi:hypothetical protein